MNQTFSYMILMNDIAIPATNDVLVDYPIQNVKQAVAFLLECYSPKYFIPKKMVLILL